MKALIRKLADRLQRLSPLAITAIGGCLVLALGELDYVSPRSMSFIFTYLLIVVFVGWGAGKWHAVFLAFLAILIMVPVQWGLHRSTPHGLWIFLWNNSTRLLVFCIAGWLTAEVTRLTRHLSDLVEERTAQLKAETEQHKATSSRLGEALERFEQVINNITEVFWLTDVPKNQMAYVSPAYERIWGRKCEDLYREPHSWLAAVHPEDRDTIARRARTDQAAGSYDVEYRIIRPDGAVRWIRDRAFPVRNEQGEVYRIAGIADDITERKQTREALQTQAAILENMAEGVVVTDERGVIVQMNPAGEQIWGYERNEVLGQPVSVLSGLPEPEATAGMREVLGALQAAGSWRGMFQNRRKDGSSISCEAVISRLEIQGRVLMVAVEQDVTERVRAQEQLQIQARVLESMAEAVLMVDENGTIVLTNPALDTLLGYKRGELVGKSMLVVSGHAPGEDRAQFEANLEQIKTGGSIVGEYLARRKDGTLIEVETRTSGVSVGNRLCLVVVGQDITQRKRAEQALRESEETLRVFLDALPEPAFLLDQNGTILVSNRALPRSLGIPEGELIGKPVFSLLPASIGETRKAMFDQVTRTRQPAQFEDAREGRHFMNFASPILDSAGTVTRVAVFALDITERKQVESALARQEALYRTLFELSPDCILLEDLNGNILDANQALCQLFGYSREELLRQNVRCLVPPDGQREVEVHLTVLRAGQKLEHEVWNLRKNGERCLMWLNEKPLTLPDGRQGILIVARDITQSKRAEMTKEALLSLGAKLSAVRTPVEAAKAVYAGADQLWKWDTATLSIYSPETDRMEPVLFYDVMDGKRGEVIPVLPAGAPTARMRRIMQQGAELILRKEGDRPDTESLRFGDTSRVSASIMCVPMCREGQPVGVLSIQSYTPDAYSQEDLRTLQALADHCAGALARLRVEQALEQREELNRTILATAMDGFFALDFGTDPRGAITEVNEAYCRLTGYRREELLQMRIADLEAEETPEKVARHKEMIIAARGERFETRHRRKDGQETHVEISVSRLGDSTEQTFSFVRDITERKRAELMKEAFLSLRAKLSTARSPLEAARAVYASADLLWKWDSASLDIYVSESDRMHPVLNCDLVDGQRREVPPVRSAGTPSARMRRIMEHGAELILEEHPIPLAEFLVFGDTSRLSASMMYVPLRREGHAVGVLSIDSYKPNAYTQEDLRTLQALADYCGGALERIGAEAALREAHDKLELRVQERTAELQAANEALRESEVKYRRLFESMTDAFVRVDLTGRIVESNPAYRALLGYAEDELRQLTYPDLTPREWHDFEARLVAEQILPHGYSDVYAVEYRRKDGTVFPVELRTFLLRDADGQPAGMWAIVRDITERRRAEAGLREAHDKLEARVRERTAELQAINRALTASEERYRSLVNNLNVGVYRNKPGLQGGFVHANPALARMHGYDSVEEFQQVRVADLYQDPREREKFLGDLRREGALRNYEVRLKKRDGTPIYGSVNATAHRGPDGEVEWIDGVLEDITQRKQAREALRASEERYRALAESSPDAIFILDRDIRVQYVNSTAAALWRRAPEELIGLKQAELFPRETAEYHAHVVRGVFETGNPVRRDEPLAFPVGDQWIEIRLAPLYDAQGLVSSVMGVCRDITERKRAERQLAEALDLNQKMIAASAMGIAAYKASGECVFANEALARTVGGSVSKVLEGNFRRLKSWQESGLLQLAEEALNQGQGRSGEVYATTRFGKSVWLDGHVAPFVSNGQPHLLLLALDISERKWAETALKQAERLQRAILDNIPDPAWLKDTQGRFLACNQAIARFYGRPVEAIVGKTVFDCIPPEAVRTTREDKEIITTRRSVVVEAPVADAHGRVRWMESIKAPLFNERDEVIGVTGIARDVTERHRLQRQILEISDREQARIGQDIHDGLCQQLVSLAFDANSLERELAARRRPEAKKARRIARFLDQAITESRQLSRGLFPVRLEKEGLPSALEELARTTRERFGIRCRFDGAATVGIENSAVATHLYRVAQEAVANAVKHSRAAKVSISLRTRADQLELRIKDNGVGLSPVARRKATGLGLHIMDYRARTIGGTLHVGPGRRGGTAVSCCVPRAGR